MPIPLIAILGGAGMGMGVTSFVPPLSNIVSQGAYRKIPNELVTVGDAVELRYRNLIDQTQYDDELVMQGLNDVRREWAYQVSENLLNVMELINLYRRGAISQSDLIKQAALVKWSEDNINQLVKVTEVIPSAQDIIAFAVREVYSPEIAEAFGQFEGVDEVFNKAKKDIIAIGMTKETFAKFWAAHWVLPSVGQGFQMLHRGVIPFSSDGAAGGGKALSLERLMTALDVMPAWREPLTKISYNPYTRVDVRRMNKIGVILDEELPRAYMDLGYDEEKAAKMTEFTIKYNADPPEEEKTVTDIERDLTKSDLLNGYRDALLEEGEVRDGLDMLGYDSNEVDYYISKVNYDKDKDETDNYLKYYHDAYIKGIMTHNNLVDKLAALNLEGKRIEYLFSVWDLERIARTTRPTKSELMTFYRKKIIDKDTLVEELKGAGYPQHYINWYLKAG